MSVIDIGSMCCDCGAETFSVFGPHWEPGWDDPCTKGPDNSVTIKYSFMPEGCALGEVDHGSPAETLPWNFPYGGVTEQEFKDEIRDAIEFWEKVFEEQFDWLDLNFVDLGDEPGTVGDGGVHGIDDGNGVGDIRFGVAHWIGYKPSVLAHAWPTYQPTSDVLGVLGTRYKDVHFSPYFHWRLDGEAYDPGEGEGQDTEISGAGGDDILSLVGCSLCSRSTTEEQAKFESLVKDALDSHYHHHAGDNLGFSVLRVAAHELGHVFGLFHSGTAEDTDGDGEEDTTDDLMYARVFPSDDMPGDMGAAAQSDFEAIYEAATVEACVANLGIVDICEVTVAGELDLEGEFNDNLEESPAHLLGTVYYAKERRYDTATTQGLTSIIDALEESASHFCPGDPACRGTVTTWGEETLYILSPDAAIEKVNLAWLALTPPCPIARWWVSEPDFREHFNESGNPAAASYLAGDLDVKFDMTKINLDPSKNVIVSPLGLGRPTGLGWDSSLENPLTIPMTDEDGDGFPDLFNPSGIQVNPRGEFLDGDADISVSYSGLEPPRDMDFVFDCGYGDTVTATRFVAPLFDKNPGAVEGRHILQNFGLSKIFVYGTEDSDPGISTLGMGTANTVGVATFWPPGHQILNGWIAPEHEFNTEGELGRIMADTSFLASESAPPAKVIPQIVARNNSPYAVGGYTQVTAEAVTEPAEIIVLAELCSKWAKEIVGEDTTMIVDGDVVYLWPPRHGRVRRSGAEAYETFTEVGTLIRAEIEKKTDAGGLVGKLWNGNSVIGGEESSLTLWSNEMIGKAFDGTATYTGGGDQRGMNPLRPDDKPASYYINPMPPGEFKVWYDWLAVTPVDNCGFANPHPFLGQGGKSGLIGYWTIKRDVGVLKYTQVTTLVSGFCTSSDGEFPHIATSGANSTPISEIDYYKMAGGTDLPHTFALCDDGLESDSLVELLKFPWAGMTNIPTPTTKTPYVTEVPIGVNYEGASYGVAHTSEPTGLPQRSRISYYNRTNSKDVFLVEVETPTPDVDAPKYFSVTDFPGGGGPPTPIFVEGISGGVTPTVAGGYTIEWDGPAPNPDNSPVSDPLSAPAYVYCNVTGTDINTYERWSAGGSFVFATRGDAPVGELPVFGEVQGGSTDVEVPTFGEVKEEPVQGLGLYPRTQLWFGGDIIYDTMDGTVGGGAFTQAVEDGVAITNWQVSTDGYSIIAADTNHVPERDYPRTDLYGIEVLPGDRLAVLTREIRQVNSDTLTYGPETLSVFKDGVRKWSVEAEGDFVTPAIDGALAGAAKIVTSSDYWIHVIDFPLDVKEHSGERITSPPADRATFKSWLFSLEDGLVKVPARIDEGNPVLSIGPGAHIDNASWATLWEHGGDDLEDSNFDAPRKSSIIDACVPKTMHPSVFF